MAHSSNADHGREDRVGGENGWSIPASRLNWQAPRLRREVRWRGKRISLPTAGKKRVAAGGPVPPRAIFRPEVKIGDYPREKVGLYSCWALVVIVAVCSIVLLVAIFL